MSVAAGLAPVPSWRLRNTRPVGVVTAPGSLAAASRNGWDFAFSASARAVARALDICWTLGMYACRSTSGVAPLAMSAMPLFTISSSAGVRFHAGRLRPA
jgi:hypothetical protein